jgi:hypothetical protein
LALHSFEIQTWADLPRGIVAAEQAGAPGLAHLLRALRAGRIAFLPLMPECSNARFKQFAALTKNRPAIVLVPDDDYRNRGPAGWQVAERAVHWASNILLHAAGAELFHYEAAVQAVQLTRRLLFIESNTTTAERWVDLIDAAQKRKNTTVIWPSGGPHPIVPGREALQ